MVRSRAPVAGSGSAGPDGGGGGGGGRPPPPNPAMPYRDDCWSEGATSILINAWGDRYLEVTRGNLRQKDWQEVADAVNSRKTVVKRPHRTDVQCKNRIDTIKKKFKSEKARIEGDGGGLGESQWPFYTRLETLIGSTAAALPNHPASASARKKKKTKNSPNSPLHLLPAPPPPPPPPPTRKRSVATLMADSSLKWGNYSAAAAAAAAARDDEPDPDTESSKSSGYAVHPKRRLKKKVETRAPVKTRGFGHREDEQQQEEDGVKDLASAITRFGEIYERVEIAKQKQMIELEKQRMEFNKELEFQKMQMFIDSQVQIRRIKRESGNGGEHSEISGLEMLNLQLIKMIS